MKLFNHGIFKHLFVMISIISINNLYALQILSDITAAVKANCRNILADGAAKGKRASVFAKIGDSITESCSFLCDVGDEWHTWDSNVPSDEATYQPVVTYFKSTINSFRRASLCAMSGMTITYPFGGNPTNLAREITATLPAFAIIMYGTNDVQAFNDTTPFRTGYVRLIEAVIDSGVIPIISTIPDRQDLVDINEDGNMVPMGPRVPKYNDVIRALAAEYQIPLIDFSYACSSIVDHGVEPADGIHPSIFNGSDGANFVHSTGPTDRAHGLCYGYNVRNFTFIQMMEKVRRIIIDDGMPDDAVSTITGPQDKIKTLAISCTPNPFNPVVTIAVSMQQAAGGNDAKIEIFGVHGKLVTQLPATSAGVLWNATNQPSGVYAVKATVNGQSAVSRVILQK